MTNLTIELPPRLAHALAARHIDEEQAQQIALAALELTARDGKIPFSPSTSGEAADFARSLIDANRPLFEELARR